MMHPKIGEPDGYLMDISILMPAKNEASDKILRYDYVEELIIKFDEEDQKIFFRPINGSKETNLFTEQGFKVKHHCTLYIKPIASQTQMIVEVVKNSLIEIKYFDKDYELPFK